MAKYVVVGGGIAGLYASIYLLKKGHAVQLIEASSYAGGLLKSVPNEEGFEFDCGSHFLRDTGIAEIDEELFYPLNEKDWQRLPYLKIGTFFNEKFYGKSSFIDSRCLPPDIYAHGLAEMFALPPTEELGNNAKEYMELRFGCIFTENLFREPIEKLAKEKLENLAPQTARFYDLVRIICLSPEASREIKKSKWFDDRVAFHSSTEGLAGVFNYYPTKGGIGSFIQILLDLIHSLGGEIILNQRVEQVTQENGILSAVQLQSGKEITADHFVWTIPPFTLAQAFGYKSAYAPPKINVSILFDLIVDKPFLVQTYYVVNYSKKYQSFRIFLYPHANKEMHKEGHYPTCVEVITTKEGTESVTAEEILNELKQTHIVALDAKCMYKRRRIESAGFPVFTNDFVNGMKDQVKFVDEHFKNVALVGKATGRVFFMNETLRDTHLTLQEYGAQHERG